MSMAQILLGINYDDLGKNRLIQIYLLSYVKGIYLFLIKGIYLHYWNSAQTMHNKWDKNLVNIFKLIVENGILKNIKVWIHKRKDEQNFESCLNIFMGIIIERK